MRLHFRTTHCALVGLSGLLLSTMGSAQSFHVENLRTEYAKNPIGLDEPSPRLSWILHAERRGTMQTAYEIRVAPTEAALPKPAWTSGKVTTNESVNRPYAGPALKPGTRYYWQVRSWDDRGTASDWSMPAFWETGLISSAGWSASWISPSTSEDTTRSNAAPILRKEFALDAGTIASARAYVTALGLYEMQINGRRVGDQMLAPGWTSYDKRLEYQSYDVTDLVKRGRNAVGVTLGDGWYRGRLAWETRRNTYGKQVALLAQVVVTYADGHQQVIGTDGSWKASTGPILDSDIYNGETYDARLERKGWTDAGFADANWVPVKTIEHAKDILISPAGPPIRRIEELVPIKIIRTPAGEIVADMGQNMVGWVRLRATGPSGTTIRLHHAEVLDKAGNFYTANLRTAKQTDTYTLKGGGEEVFEPHFTFHGFRYVKIEGFPGTVTPAALTGIVVHSDMPRTGQFETSDAMLNQLYHNIVWGQKGNFVGVPTDCPQRDERLGWTGDAQVFARTAAFNFDVAGFFTNWLGDAIADQRPIGSFPDVIPDVLTRGQPNATSSAGWGDAGVIIPWTMYLAYGDMRLLERQYPSMKRYVEYQHKVAGDALLWNTGAHYGDWLAFATVRADYPGATTDKDLIATAFFAHSTDLLARSAAALGKTDDARQYRDLFERIKTAWNKEFTTASGRLSSNTQTAYSLALRFNLLPEGERAEAGDRLAKDVRSFGHLTTGFLGTPYITDALTQTGHLTEAYRLLLNRKYPSWLYPITQGATTIWERWDGEKPDGSFQETSMNSFNHYAYGAIGDWMVRTVAGLDLDENAPGYRHVVIHPMPGGGLTNARAELMTQYGSAVSGWKIDAGAIQVIVRIPANTSATVLLPDATLAQVMEGGQPVATAPGVQSASQDGKAVLVVMGSGDYAFRYPYGAK
ncbi:MAG: glycoside hydrolase family 78 protein [Gemmatimonadota bacterium]|nr:glycoside hydrolase family 78 protein [Gemmatimonadota bacterium]